MIGFAYGRGPRERRSTVSAGLLEQIVPTTEQTAGDGSA